ncbi:unnamed protein product [Spirodela intermedia]|uniref:Glycosyltransferase n=1 Tax=Spirodela intermedia TaxID=51605 RepID=A0A7I8IFT8_SPIIN|nr:unnamed protein product [Spirodela intermedia]CAA6656770.1 unnamed protein product [Spirodela intermedia]
MGPHVIVIPFPAQGQVTPMLKLAEILCLAGIRVTFLNSHHNHRRLLSSAAVGARLARRPGLHLRSIPDGVPEDHPRTADRMMELFDSFNAAARPAFRELLLLLASGGGDAPPVTCEAGLPVLLFRTSSASSFWAYCCIPDLIQRGEIPFQDEGDLDALLGSVPGTESFLRRRDLPSFCRAKVVGDAIMQYVKGLSEKAIRCRGLIFNTTELAEESILAHIRKQIPLVYTIGPIHKLLKAVESTPATCTAEGGGGRGWVSSSNSSSLWKEDRASVEWLDGRPPASVVYVSFGSVTVLTKEQFYEFWHGLVGSGYDFLWVLRPGLVVGDAGDLRQGMMAALPVGRKERAFLVEWAPQEEVLAHPAVGCFLTHSGWNSTLESICAGVPMVCWPYFADQQINSRFDTCDRTLVERAVREVMEGESSTKMREAAAAMAMTTREAFAEGGSSHSSLERIIRDIKSMSS